MDPNTAASFPTGIPWWMLIFSFTITLLWTILKIINFLRRGYLDFRLTREIFLRGMELGECFYAHGVLIVHYGSVLIENAKASLKKWNGSTKEYPLEVVQYGEKYRAEHGFPQYYFISPSPLLFISQNNINRIVYLCTHKTYSILIKELISQFQLEINKEVDKLKVLKQELEPQLQGLLPEDQEYNSIMSELSEPINTIKKILEDTHAKFMDNVQLEPGSYTLSMTLYYRPKGAIIPFEKPKNITSSIKFNIDETAREQIRLQLKKLLETYVSNALFNKADPLVYPEYIPIKVEELD